MKSKFSLIVFLLCGLVMSAQQDTCVKNIVLDQAMVTAEKIKAYRDYKYVMDGHSHDTYDEALNLLHSCDIVYPDKESFWRHIIYQDRAWGKFYTIFGSTLNEIDVKTGKTIPRASANQDLSHKMIIYKGNLYSLKKRRDSGNTEISFIEKTKLN